MGPQVLGGLLGWHESVSGLLFLGVRLLHDRLGLDGAISVGPDGG